MSGSGYFPRPPTGGVPGGTLPAGSATGQLLVWNGAAWVPSAAEFSMMLAFGTQGTLSAAAGFLFPWTEVTNPGTGSEATSGSIIIPYDGRIILSLIRNSSPVAGNVVTYTVFHNGLATAIVFAHNTATVGPAFDNTELAVSQGDTIGVQYNSTIVTAPRPMIELFYRGAYA